MADVAFARSFLSDYAKRVGDLQEFYEPEHSNIRKKVIAYYLTTTNQIPIEQKIVVAACMGKEGDFKNAANLLEEYVKVFTNTTRGWTMLGTSYGMLDDYAMAIPALEKAISLGDEPSIPGLCGTALEAGRLDVVKKYVPDLLRLKDSSLPPDRVKQTMVGLLADYAGRTNDEELFAKALSGVEVHFLLPRKDVVAVIENACKKFNSPKMNALCQQISAARKNSKPEN